MTSLLPSIIILGPVALAAAGLAWWRPSPPSKATERAAAARLYAWTIPVQGIHFIEEAMTGFHERVPAVFGLPPMPFALFVAFNLIWIVIWLATIPGIGKALRFAFFAAWFLGIAGVINFVAHPALALATGGYFPGLATAPLIGVLAAWLALRLYRAGSSRESPQQHADL